MAVVNTTDVWSAAATVFIVVALSVLTAVAAWEHRQRREEHEHIEQVIHMEVQQLVCSSRLNLFFQTFPKDHKLTIDDIPTEYWMCLPRNLIEGRK